MKRRIYETLQDRQREDWVMGKIAKSFGPGWGFRRSSKLSSYDGELTELTNFGPRAHALIEVKCRTTKQLDHGMLIVTKKKIDSGIKIATARGLEYILAVRWMDVIAWLRIDRDLAKAFIIEFAGRTDRNDPKDREPCYMIPVHGFTVLMQA